jgi:hypothetical protein
MFLDGFESIDIELFDSRETLFLSEACIVYAIIDACHAICVA